MKTIPYSIERSKKRKKSISILVTKTQEVIVRAPHHTSDRYIEDLIEKSRDWIHKKLAALQNVVHCPKRQWVTGEVLQYLGESYTIEVWPIPSKKAACELMGQTLFIKCLEPHYSPSVKKVVEAWYRKQAKKILSERTLFFANIMNLFPTEIIVKQQKNRWGSCDQHNIIRYNWKAIMASMPLVDYLVVHELAHIKEKNHGPNFWAVVEKEVADYKEKRKALKSFHAEFD